MLIDDEKLILKSLKRVLGKVENYEVECYESAELALTRAQSSIYDVFISDYRMPEMNGVEFLSQVKDIQPEAIRVILSAFTEIDVLMGAINNASIYRFIAKPWSDADLLQTVEQAIEYKCMISENRHLAEMVRQQSLILKSQQSTLKKLGANHVNFNEIDKGRDDSIELNNIEQSAGGSKK